MTILTDSTKMSMLEPELENRDPNSINTHSVVTFYEVIGEPDDMHSSRCTWTAANKCFDCTIIGCYRLMTAICGIPLAVIWALNFACVGFTHVWGLTPFIHCLHINFISYQRIFGQCVHCFCDPLCESVALFFSHIKITTDKTEC